MAVNQIAEVAPEILSKCRFLIEGKGRNTAPAIILSAMAADNDVLFVTPADHLITHGDEYESTILSASKAVLKGRLLTFGITPTMPTSQYGYIEAEPQSQSEDGEKKVLHFHEKPDEKTAEGYLAKGHYFWNSGMFMFTRNQLLKSAEAHAPTIYAACQSAWNERTESGELNSTVSPFVAIIKGGEMADIPSESIDTALFEKADNVSVIPAAFQWSDVGGFNALHDAKSLDNNAAPISINTENNFVHSYNNKLVATLGVKNLNIIDTPDALLVASKDHMHEMRSLYDEVRSRSKELVDYHVTSQRPWGSYTVLNQGEGYKVKRIEVLPGKRLSLQRHQYRAEHWVVVSGTAKVTINETDASLLENESVYIPIGALHRLENSGKETLIIIEVQSGSRVIESDIERLDDDYQRI